MKNKVTRNKPQPSSEEVNARKDFSSVLQQHKAAHTGNSVAGAKGVFRFGWMHGVGLAIAAVSVGAVLYFSGVFDKKGAVVNPAEEVIITDKNQTIQPADNSDMISKAAIAPPFKGIDIPFSNYSVKAGKETVLTHTSGSKIKIPKNAFIGNDGAPVTGEVNIRYREFRNPADIFIAGIPMTYDSAGTQYHFESAGMMEIYAFKNGQVVKMHPDKLIEVELVSNDKSNKHNLYQFDTAGGNWAYKGKDQVKEAQPVMGIETFGRDSSMIDPEVMLGQVMDRDVKLVGIMERITVVQAEISKLSEKMPPVPVKADKKKHNFNLEVDPKEFPDLATYKGVLFEVGAENRDFTEQYYNVVWDDAVLSEGKKGVNYILTLKEGKQVQKLIVYPVFDGKNYEKAMAEHKQKFGQYQAKLDERKAEERKLQGEAEERTKQLREELKVQQKKQAEEARKITASIATANNIVRVFSIDGFGLWNCDTPFMLPRGNEVAASFTDDKMNELVIDKVYLVEKGRNAIFTYYSYKYNELGYNPKTANMIWGVTRDNRLVKFSYEDFKGIPNKKGAYRFVMEVAEKELRNDKEIRDFLGV